MAKKEFLTSNPIEMHLPDMATTEIHNIQYRITAPFQKGTDFNCDRRPKYLGIRKLLFLPLTAANIFTLGHCFRLIATVWAPFNFFVKKLNTLS